MTQGLFITFEGVEGAGKSTQIELLRGALAAAGCRVAVTREPGGDAVAEAIRGILLTSKGPVDPRAELLLFLASRAQATARVLRPQLRSHDVVLCDRFADSTIAYQGYGRGLDIEAIRDMNRFATEGLEPDLTVLLDLDPETGLSRQLDGNRMEGEPIKFHRRVREGYLREALRHFGDFPASGMRPDQLLRERLRQGTVSCGRYRIIDASRPAQDIHAEIVSQVMPLLSAKGCRAGLRPLQGGLP